MRTTWAVVHKTQ